MKIAAVLAALAPLASAQAPRAPVLITSDVGSYAPLVATSGDLSAVLYGRDDEDELWVRTSDGRGIVWAAPVRVDSDASGPYEVPIGVAIVGQRVLVLSADDRFGTGGVSPRTDLFLNAYDTQTGIHDAELLLDKWLPPNTGYVASTQLVATTGGAEEYVYVVAHVWQRATPPFKSEVVFLASSDGGKSFGATQVISSPAGDDVWAANPDLVADGPVVHVAWSDDHTGTNQAYCRRSDDAGQGFGPAVQISDLAVYDGPVLSGSGQTLAAVWAHEVAFGERDARASVSVDGGATFPPEQVVGQYDPHTDAVQGINCAVTADGGVFVTWADFSTGEPHTYAARSLDGGATFQPDEQLSTGQGGGAALAAAGTGLACAWSSSETDDIRAAFAMGSDAAFHPEVSLSAPLPDGSGVVGLAHNALYNNIIALWTHDSLFTSNVDLYAGGFRPQTLIVTGYAPGAAAPTLSFSDFDVSGATQVWFLLSHAQGSLILPDGRNLGLLPDALFGTTLSLAAQGFLAAPLQADGTAVIGPIPTFVGPGSIFAVGLAVNPFLGTVDDITDTVKLTPSLGG